MTPAPAPAAAGRPVTEARRASRGSAPGLRVERSLLADGALLAGVDEVGRGAVAGPVTVGVVVVDGRVGRPPRGLRDSKLLTPQQRTALVPGILRWAVAAAVGHSSAAEIDDLGILAALRLAGRRALGRLPEPPDRVLLDGNYDWLNRPRQIDMLFDLAPGSGPAAGEAATGTDTGSPVPVHLMVKADLRCASVAAASVLAKVDRDAIMADLARHHPEYAWQDNRGYATPAHLDVLRALGSCPAHRRSWRLPAGPDGPDAGWDGGPAGLDAEPADWEDSPAGRGARPAGPPYAGRLPLAGSGAAGEPAAARTGGGDPHAVPGGAGQ